MVLNNQTVKLMDLLPESDLQKGSQVFSNQYQSSQILTHITAI